jgi:hypothetical protein
MPGQFAIIRGDAGNVFAGGGVVGIISKWAILPVRMKVDGKPELQFKAQFSWKNDVLLGMISKGIVRPRVQVRIRSKVGLENIDIVQWQQWRMDGGILYLDDIVHFEGVKAR